MTTVVLEVRSLPDTLASATRAMKTGRAEREARIGFATPELLWQVLTAKRWELLKVLCGAGPVSIREAARRVERDVTQQVVRARPRAGGPRQHGDADARRDHVVAGDRECRASGTARREFDDGLHRAAVARHRPRVDIVDAFEVVHVADHDAVNVVDRQISGFESTRDRFGDEFLAVDV